MEHRYEPLTETGLYLFCSDCCTSTNNVIVPVEDIENHDRWHATGHYHWQAPLRIADLAS